MSKPTLTWKTEHATPTVVDIVLHEDEPSIEPGAAEVRLRHVPTYLLVRIKKTQAEEEPLVGLERGVLPLEAGADGENIYDRSRGAEDDQDACHRFQISYFEAIQSHADLPVVQSIRSILLSTRKAAYAQHDYLDSADIYDAFIPRNVFDHPELRGLLNSDMMDVKGREEMAKLEAGVMAQQPAPPKWCYETYIGYTPGGK
ncbi:hypothetical protein FRC04_001694 [Tulasnella sp. 424]|nr:hypothetical protein FRC04_001694 [Tulasnella sp. 424]KAG8975429.1 hypothetical protein FRC05_005759 [Tulasnella sp. 425]